VPDSSEFIYLEAKKGARNLDLRILTSLIQAAVKTAAEREFNSEYATAYTLSQEVLKKNPNFPWNLSTPRQDEIKSAIYSDSGVRPLSKLCRIAQGVTPGGYCLDILLIDNNRSKNMEKSCLQPAVEAEDVTGWVLGKPKKWFVFPYDNSGNVMDFGELRLDLNDEQATAEINRLIVNGAIHYPRTAQYLASFFTKLAEREFEKKSLADFGKRWYEYHRPREPKMLLSVPKIVTRRMTKNVEFAADLLGYLPTDMVWAIVPQNDGEFIEKLKSQGMESTQSRKCLLYFLLAILNSAIVKFLLKSTADFYGDDFYQVTKQFLRGIPIKIPHRNNVSAIRKIASLSSEMVSEGKSVSEEIETLVFSLYGLESKRDIIQSFLDSRR
jgi:hypothetical protein